MRLHGVSLLNQPGSQQDHSGPDPGDETIASLIQEARSGNQQAVGTLIGKYRNFLLYLANDDLDQEVQAKLGSSDVVQESMIKAQQKFHQFVGESESSFKAWLKSILMNEMNSHRRRFYSKKRNSRQELSYHEKPVAENYLLDNHLTPSSNAIQAEKEQSLKLAVQRLTTDQQQVMELRHFEQLSFVEIGKQMDRSEDAARKLWARAIEALRQMLAAEQTGAFETEVPKPGDD